MAPGARRGGRGGSSKLSLNDRLTSGRSTPDGSEDVGMSDASSSGAARRKRGGRGALHSKTPYASTSRPSSIGTSSRAAAALASITGKGTANKPTLLRETRDMKGAIESLRTLIQSRWNPEAGLLNLENMAADPAFTASKLRAPGQKGAPRQAAPALWKLAGEMCPNLVSLALSGNKLQSLTDIAAPALIRFLPKLQNLSLQNNLLTQYADLNPLSTVVGTITGSKPGLGELKELILTGNPLQEREVKKDGLEYQREVLRRFPGLRMLDMTPIDQTIPIPQASTSAAIPSKPSEGVTIVGRAKRSREQDQQQGGPSSSKRTKALLPVSMQPAFADSEASQNAMSQFLVKYFTSFDNDRSQLAFAYTPQGTFSLCVNTTVSERARRMQSLAADAIAKQKELSWGRYLGSQYEKDSTAHQENLSRNFLRTKNSQRREETLHVGPEAITALMSKLPKTSHPLSDASKFIVDTWQQPGSSPEFSEYLVVVVHGEYVEHPSMGVRSFDRTFVLAPTPPGTPAANNGWPCVIISDLLVLRNWTNPKSWQPGQEPAQPARQPPATDAAPQLSPEQQALMTELHARTRLNAQFCFQCLSETGWSLEAALGAFEAAKSSIPPEAFA